MEEHGVSRVDIKPEARDLSAADLQVVLAMEARDDAQPSQAGGERGREVLDDLPRPLAGRCPIHVGDAQLARSHDDRPAAGEPAADLGTGAAAGGQVDLGRQALVPADQGAMVAIAVEPQRRRAVGFAPRVPAHQRLIQRESLGGSGTVVGQQPPRRAHLAT